MFYIPGDSSEYIKDNKNIMSTFLTVTKFLIRVSSRDGDCTTKGHIIDSLSRKIYRIDSINIKKIK